MSEGGPTVRTTLTVIGVLWIISVLVLIYVYYARNFTQYVETASESAPATVPGDFVLSSPAFDNGEAIPSIYTCDAKQTSPPLTIEHVPEGTQSMLLIMEDRDIPENLKADGTFLHWVVFNISPDFESAGPGEVFGTQGAVGNGAAGYMGPCPPRQYEPTEHRYYFDLYALDTTLELAEGASVHDVRAAMDTHVISHAEYMGRYDRAQ